MSSGRSAITPTPRVRSLGRSPPSCAPVGPQEHHVAATVVAIPRPLGEDGPLLFVFGRDVGESARREACQKRPPTRGPGPLSGQKKAPHHRSQECIVFREGTSSLARPAPLHQPLSEEVRASPDHRKAPPRPPAQVRAPFPCAGLEGLPGAHDSPRTPNDTHRDTETTKRWREKEEKARNCGPPTHRGSTLLGPTFSRFGPPTHWGSTLRGSLLGKTLKH